MRCFIDSEWTTMKIKTLSTLIFLFGISGLAMDDAKASCPNNVCKDEQDAWIAKQYAAGRALANDPYAYLFGMSGFTVKKIQCARFPVKTGGGAKEACEQIIDDVMSKSKLKLVSNLALVEKWKADLDAWGKSNPIEMDSGMWVFDNSGAMSRWGCTGAIPKACPVFKNLLKYGDPNSGMR